MNRGYTLENLTEAMALFKEAHKRDSNLPTPMIGIAAVSIDLVDTLLAADPEPYLEQAETFLQRALPRKPDDGRIHFYLGRVHLARGRHEAALGAFARVLEITPDSPFARGQIGLTMMRSGRAAEGIGYIRQAIELRPNSARTGYLYILAGAAELQLGRTEAALQWLLRAQTVLPSGIAPLHRALAAAYALHGDAANAAKHAAELRRIVPAARLAGITKERGSVRVREGLTLALSYPNKEP